MSRQSPEKNMVILANAAELSRCILTEILGDNTARTILGQAISRKTLYDLQMSKIQQHLNPIIQRTPSGQFGKTVSQSAAQPAGTPISMNQG